ncbi:MAG: SDR family oxidoreductase [Candidatus Eremiobacteraeota bacterium]|nr:SDR family oxidoreductase [Candidatus Eremiobacteraeota bacterium]
MENDWYEAGHVAIVTGGSRGLGKAVARELLARGLHVVIDGRDEAALAAARDELARVGNVIAVPGDVADQQHVHDLIASARQLRRLDLVVNNASTLGEIPLPRVEELSRETFERIFQVNLFAPIHIMQHALHVMRRSAEGGTIVNITSDAAIEAYPAWGGYGASKAALEHVSRVLATELDGTHVRVLVADPGDMDTQMHRDAIPDADPRDLRDPADSARALLRAVAEMKEAYVRVRLADLVPA